MRDRRVTRTKKAIQKAYLDLLQNKGTDKITISDIAREADIDRKTFYLHYDSTEDIIKEYAEEKTRELLLRLTVKSFFSLSFDRKIFAREVNSMLAEHLEFCRMIARNDSLGFFWNEVQNVAVDILSEIYARHSRLPESDLRIQVSFFVAGAMYVYQRWLRDEIPCSMEELGDKVSQIAFTGVQSILRQS
jgi:AcrR family transcriptional regulator